MRAFILMLFSSLLTGLSAFSMSDPGDSTRSRRWYIPHYVPVQFAGNIGFISTGAGYNSTRKDYQLALMYGHVPRSLAHTTIHTITAKNNFPLLYHTLKNNQTIIPYLGLGLTLEVGGNAFFKMPSHFPESYYDFPKNVHVIAYGGARLQRIFSDDIRLLRGIEVYAEGGTVDVYLWYKTMSDNIKFRQIFSLAVGVNLLLAHD